MRRVEDLAASLAGPAAAAGDAALSPTTRLAAMLKEALAANTIGGKVDDDSRWRAAQEDVRQAQAAGRASGWCQKRSAVRWPIASSGRSGDLGGAAATALQVMTGKRAGSRVGQAEPDRSMGRKARRGGQGPEGLEHAEAVTGLAVVAYRPFLPLLNLDQLDVEHQHAVRRALALVGEALGNPEARLLALDHQLHAFGPAGDHAVQRETSPARRASTELSNILPSVVQPV